MFGPFIYPPSNLFEADTHADILHDEINRHSADFKGLEHINEYNKQKEAEQLIIDEILISPNLYVAEYFLQLKSEIDIYFVKKAINKKQNEDKTTDTNWDDLWNKRWRQFIDKVSEFEQQTTRIKIDLVRLKAATRLIEIQNIIFRNRCIMFCRLNAIEYKLIIFEDCFFPPNVQGYRECKIDLFMNLDDKDYQTPIITKKITDVTVMDTSYYFLKNLPSNFFFNCKMLKRLILAWNGIIYLMGDTFYGLDNLQSLDLKHNKLTSVVFENFQYLKNMRFLNLSDNFISKIESGSFDSLNELRYLSLKNNNLRIIPKNLFINNVKLSFLDLSCNLFTIIKEHWFLTTRELRYLNISQNLLVVMDNICFDNLINLKMLNLNSNYLLTLQDNHFVNLKSLETLKIQNMRSLKFKITTKCFFGLDSLKSLDIGYNNLCGDSDMFCTIFDPLFKLKKLFIFGIQIESKEKTSEKVQVLNKYAKIKGIVLYKTKEFFY